MTFILIENIEVPLQIYKNTSIPFVLGQSTIYGADCVGLLILTLKNHGYKCEWEDKIIRQPGKYAYFKRMFSKCNFIRDDNGVFALIRDPRSAHVGLISEDQIIYQDNKIGRTNVVPILKNIYRYSYLGDTNSEDCL
jgi:hypothetical protein